MTDYAAALAAQFNLKKGQTEKLIELIDAGNTIPFIARYRKEEHGSLDDQTIRSVFERLEYLRGLDSRREEVRGLIENAGSLTDEIAAALGKAATLAEIDDIYRPYRPKRKTRASVAKARGLEPLAQKILAQEKRSPYPIDMAEDFVDAEKGVETPEDALAGAKDIIAEIISDDAAVRRRLRLAAMAQGIV
ncbi:MAG: Tex-like N-terminal domain-containing protein, partial [Acutalibacteraceae bacterium]